MTAKNGRAIAFYLPQFHPIPENDEWWGRGSASGQMRQRLDRSSPAIDSRIYRLISASMTFACRSRERHKLNSRSAMASKRFAIGTTGSRVGGYSNGRTPRCWKQDNRTFPSALRGRINPGPAFGTETRTASCSSRLILVPRMTGGTSSTFCPAFRDERYLRVDGKPLFYLFRPELHPEPAAFVERWQAMAVGAGLEGLFLVAEVSDLLGAGPKYLDFQRDGFDGGVYMRIPAKVNRWSIAKNANNSKASSLARALRLFDPCRLQPPHSVDSEHLYPCVYPNWDNTPRAGRRGLVFSARHLKRFGRHVRAAVESLQAASTRASASLHQVVERMGRGQLPRA